MSFPPESPLLTASAAAWLAGLRAFVTEQRQQPSRSLRPPSPPAEQAAEANLIANHLRAWLAGLPQLLRQQHPGHDRWPAIAITTSTAGLAAANGLAAEPQLAAELSSCCLVTESEYRFWCKQQPDPQHRLHANHWAWIKTQVPAARAAEFAGFPLPAGSRHWLFRHGLSGLDTADHHSCRLYAWDGRTATLLAERFREGVSGL